MSALQEGLAAKVKKGRKLFVPYITAGLPSPQGFIDLFSELSWSADAIEVGIPFSDPIMDGPVIQESSQRALERGVTVAACFSMMRQALDHGAVPGVFMTYFNPIHRMGQEAFAESLSGAGVAGLIVPDLPFEESSELSGALAAKRISHIRMISPNTSPDRAARLSAVSTGWVYAVTRLGVTGEQHELGAAAEEVVAKVRDHSKAPVLLGIGISNGAQAKQAAQYADGVIVGSAIVKRVLDGDPDGAVELAGEIRRALDSD